MESSGHAHESKINALVAIWVALTATFMALCNVKDGNIMQAMSQAQSHSIDAWAYYRAKSTKQAMLQNSVEMLRAQNNPAYTDLIHKDELQVALYDNEKAEIKRRAEDFQKEYDDINVFDDQFDMTDALLSIAIAMLGITALTKKRWLFYFAVSISVLGIVLGVAAFLKISLHSDLVSKILG